MTKSAQDLRVAALQTDLHWENPKANILSTERQMDVLNDSTDLIVLPEMWATGFSMKPDKIAMEWDDRWRTNPDQWPAPLQAMLRWSQEKNAAVVGSLSCKILRGKRYVNRCFFVSPTQGLEWYDKRHLFGFAGENDVYSAGGSSKNIEWRGWKLRLQICYDLRFPVFGRNQASNPYDVLIYVANWPKSRISAWKALVNARAIENQCYAIGVNRIGADGNGIAHNGCSLLLHPKGHALAESIEDESVWIQATLSAKELIDFRAKFPVLDDADSFEIKQTRSVQ
ncbi:MAG: nitrilase family protein [Crocinitomicaceae bacterium]|jgi:predicted amidohydrolase|nr:nitrilase family protein [Crocinitomicaceae bacterium]|tara:strand:+ start:753 stop:1601 length:849 start_codon:yes stop_codon:yes gene_type:complete